MLWFSIVLFVTVHAGGNAQIVGLPWAEVKMSCDLYMIDDHRNHFAEAMNPRYESLEPAEPPELRICRCFFHPKSVQITRELYCPQRVLMKIPQNIPNDTRGLWLNQNHLDMIENQLANLTELQYLSLAENEISFLGEGAFEGLTTLEELDLSKNSLREVPFHASLFSDLVSLRRLNLAFNNLHTLENGTFNRLVKLETLLLHHNSLPSIPESVFPALPNLRTLMLNNNKLTNIWPMAFNLLEGLEVLSLDNNPLYMLSSGQFHSLTELDQLSLAACHMRLLPPGLFAGLHLTSLTLDNNSFHLLPSAIIHLADTLQNFSFSGNPVQALGAGDFLQLTSLTILRLSNMPALEVIGDGTFSSLSSLTELHLDKNQLLQNLSARAFKGLTSLQVLRLDNGGLQNMEEQVVDWPAEGVQPCMYLSGNPWHCDCHTRWLGSLAQQREELLLKWSSPDFQDEDSQDKDRNSPEPGLVDASDLRCEFPSAIRDHRMVDLHLDLFVCDNETTDIGGDSSQRYLVRQNGVQVITDHHETALYAFIGTFTGLVVLTLMINSAQRYAHWRSKYRMSGRRTTGRAPILLPRRWQHRAFRRMSNDSTESVEMFDNAAERVRPEDDSSPCAV